MGACAIPAPRPSGDRYARRAIAAELSRHLRCRRRRHRGDVQRSDQPRGRSSGGRHSRQHHGRQHHPAVQDPRPGRRAQRPPAPGQGDQVAGEGDRQGPVPGRAARQAPGARALLGYPLRLAQDRAEAQRAAAVRDRDRRARHPVHPHPLQARERAAADHHARLARLDPGDAEGDRAAHRPHCLRWTRSGRLPPGHPVDARLRLLGAADDAWLERRPDRPGLGRTDEAARLQPLCLAGWRLGCGGLGQDGQARLPRPAGHPRQHARDRAAGRGQGAQQR